MSSTSDSVNPIPSEHVADLVEAYLAGGLDPDERARFEAHVSLCAACARVVAEIERADVELRSLFAAARPDAGLEDRVLAGFRDAAAPDDVSPAVAGPVAPGLLRLAPGTGGPPAVRRPAKPRHRPLLHPMVRLAAAGVAAAVVLGAVGVGASLGMGDDAGPLGRPAFLSRWLGEPEAKPRPRKSLVILDDTVSTSVRDLESPARLARRTRESLREDSQPPGGIRREFRAAQAARYEDLDASGAKRGDVAALGDGEVNGRQNRAPDQGQQDTARLYFRSHGEKDAKAVKVVAKEEESVRGRLGRVSTLSGKTGEALSDESSPAAGVPGTLGGPGGGSGRSGAGFGVGGGGGGGRGGMAGGRFGSVPADTTFSKAGTGVVAVDATLGLAAPDDWLTKPGGQPGQGQGRAAAPAAPAPGEPPRVAQFSDGNAEFGYAVEGVKGGQGVHTWGLGSARGYTFNEQADAAGKAAGAAPSGNNDAAGIKAPVVLGKAFKPAEAFKADVKERERTETTAGRGVTNTTATNGGTVELKVLDGATRGLDEAAPKPPDELAAATATAGDVTKAAEEFTDRRESERSKLRYALAEGADGKEPDKDGDGPTRADPTVTPPPPAAADPAGGPAGFIPPPPLVKPAAGPKAARPQADPAPIQRKMIRNGEMAFEVDSFDSAAAQINKIADEEGGQVANTDSEKLPNGKVKGSIVVRVPPERLDTLVLKLRGLGDLKTQKIVAQDVTRHYVDLDSQLRAAYAMEKRLLEIIATGKGEVKDLIEAEKQLGVQREKIEAVEGELRYLNNLISLSTLTITLYERDIKTPTAAAEVETVQMGVEAEDVEKARADAIKAVDAAKGRIIEAEMRKHEAGQLAATIVADVPPDAAGPLIDRLKQLGKVARLDVNRKQVTAGGTGPVAAAVKVERKDTRFQVSLYNLANIAPRQTTTLNIAAPDVEKAYRTILDQVLAGGGRVVASQLNRPKPDQTTGTISFEVAADKADVLATAVRTSGEVMRLEVTQNPDTQNVTEAKRGFSVQVFSLATVAPRESTQLQVAAPSVADSFNKLLEAARAGGGRILTSQLNEQDQNNVTAQLDFDVMRENWGRVETALREAGLVVTRTVNRSSDSENTVDSKVRLQVGLFDQAKLQPRETVTLKVATRTVPESFNRLLDLGRDAGGRAVSSQLNQQDKANVSGALLLHVPRENWARVEASLKDAGVVVSRNVVRAADGPMTVDTKIGLNVLVVDERSLDARESVAMTVVTPNVADRYQQVLEVLRLADAQIYQSNLAEQGPNDVTGTLDFAIRREDRAAVEKALFEKADVFNRSVGRSQDVQNTLDNKVRVQATLKDAERQPPRSTYTVGVDVADVDKAAGNFEAAAVAAGGRRIDFTHSAEQGKKTAKVIVDVPLSAAGQMIQAVRDLGSVSMTQTARNEAVPEGSLSRARVELTLRDAGGQSPRSTYKVAVEVSDVPQAAASFEANAASSGGRRVDFTQSVGDDGKQVARVVVDVPQSAAGSMIQAAGGLGTVTMTQTSRDEAVADSPLARARIELTLGNPERIVKANQGFGSAVREGVSEGLRGLFAVLKYVIIGLIVVLFVILLVILPGWGFWRLARRGRRREATDLDRAAPGRAGGAAAGTTGDARVSGPAPVPRVGRAGPP